MKTNVSNIENVMTVNGKVINSSKGEREGWRKVSCTIEYPNLGDRKDIYDAKHYAGILVAPWWGKGKPRMFQFGKTCIQVWEPRNDREEWLVEWWSGKDPQEKPNSEQVTSSLMTIDKVGERLADLYSESVRLPEPPSVVELAA